MVNEGKRYGNCKVYSPEGKLMFLCNESRLNWYLRRDLAEILTNEPVIEARLKFQPKGLGYADQDDFYFNPREDKCVACGTTKLEVLTRHHVVPYCYRKWMPDEYKSHNCYDIVKLCRSCHDHYEIEAQQLKFKIAEDLGVSVVSKRTTQVSSVKGFANTLLNHFSKLPEDVFNKMYEGISDYLGKIHLSEQDLDYIINMDYNDDPEWKSWGLECVEKLDDMEDFVKMWRQHFLEYMKPQYMPEGWEIEREVSRKRFG